MKLGQILFEDSPKKNSLVPLLDEAGRDLIVRARISQLVKAAIQEVLQKN